MGNFLDNIKILNDGQKTFASSYVETITKYIIANVRGTNGQYSVIKTDRTKKGKVGKPNNLPVKHEYEPKQGNSLGFIGSVRSEFPRAILSETSAEARVEPLDNANGEVARLQKGGQGKGSFLMRYRSVLAERTGLPINSPIMYQGKNIRYFKG